MILNPILGMYTSAYDRLSLFGAPLVNHRALRRGALEQGLSTPRTVSYKSAIVWNGGFHV